MSERKKVPKRTLAEIIGKKNIPTFIELIWESQSLSQIAKVMVMSSVEPLDTEGKIAGIKWRNKKEIATLVAARTAQHGESPHKGNSKPFGGKKKKPPKSKRHGRRSILKPPAIPKVEPIGPLPSPPFEAAQEESPESSVPISPESVSEPVAEPVETEETAASSLEPEPYFELEPEPEAKPAAAPVLAKPARASQPQNVPSDSELSTLIIEAFKRYAKNPDPELSAYQYVANEVSRKTKGEFNLGAIAKHVTRYDGLHAFLVTIGGLTHKQAANIVEQV